MNWPAPGSRERQASGTVGSMPRPAQPKGRARRHRRPGWQRVDGKWYYLHINGVMLTGWQFINNQWYYMDGSGAMVKNTWVGDYYLGTDGTMATSTWIGQYYVDDNGKWVPNKQKELEKQEPT